MKALPYSALVLLLASAAQARDYTLGELRIVHPWARATPMAGVTGGGYLSIENRGRADERLLGAQTELADHVEIHEMRMDGGVMRMRALPEGVDIPPGKTVDFAPGGTHLMLVAPKRALTAGDHIPLRLRFARAGEVSVELEVKAADAGE